MLLRDKIAMVTGANRGIGRTIVELFASHGCHIIACAKQANDEFMAMAEAWREKYHVEVKVVTLDLSDESSVKSAVKSAIEQSPRIDVLVNNAGIASGALFQMTSIVEMKRLFDVNFFHQILLTQGIARLMIKRKAGAIVNISSIASLIPDPGTMAYGTSKAAFSRATQSLATELGPHNIRVNAIAPSVTRTDMYAQMSLSAREKIVRSSALKRAAEPIEVANVALFLASDLSSYVTGQIIRVDGGII